MHQLLPEQAQQILRDAAKTQNTEQDPRAKDKAIDKAVAMVKRMYPECFRNRR